MRRLFTNLYMFFTLTFRSLKGASFPFIVGSTKVTCFKARCDIVRLTLKEKLLASNLMDLVRDNPDQQYILLAAVVDSRVKVNVYHLVENHHTPTTTKVYDPAWGVNGLFTFGLSCKTTQDDQGNEVLTPVISIPKDHRGTKGYFYDPTNPYTAWVDNLTSREDDLFDEAYHADTLKHDATVHLA